MQFKIGNGALNLLFAEIFLEWDKPICDKTIRDRVKLILLLAWRYIYKLFKLKHASFILLKVDIKNSVLLNITCI